MSPPPKTFVDTARYGTVWRDPVDGEVVMVVTEQDAVILVPGSGYIPDEDAEQDAEDGPGDLRRDAEHAHPSADERWERVT